MVCPGCYFSDLRLSKFRSTDIGQMLFLHYPVRCRDCGERSYGNLLRMIMLPWTHRASHLRSGWRSQNLNAR